MLFMKRQAWVQSWYGERNWNSSDSTSNGYGIWRVNSLMFQSARSLFTAYLNSGGYKRGSVPMKRLNTFGYDTSSWYMYGQASSVNYSIKYANSFPKILSLGLDFDTLSGTSSKLSVPLLNGITMAL